MNRRRFLEGVGLVLSTSAAGTTLATSPSTVPVSEQTDGYEPLGYVDVDGVREATVHHDGEIVYAAVGDGIASVDISDPTDPTVLAQRRDIETDVDRGMSVAWDLWASEDRLVVAGPAQSAPGVPEGVALFDIADPADPAQVAWYATEYPIHNAYFDDGIVYLTGSGLPGYPLVMVDVEDDDPEEVGRWSLVDDDAQWGEISASSRVLHDVTVQDGIAYLPYWDAGTWIVDVSDPTAPEALARAGDYTFDTLQEMSGQEAQSEWIVPDGNAHFADVNDDGTILVVGKEAWATQDPDNQDGLIGGPGAVDLWDITDKTAPEHLARIDPPDSFDTTTDGWWTTAHNCDIVGDRLYSSWYFGGVKVHDITDPANPEEIAWWRKPRNAAFWTARSAVQGETFVGSSIDLSAAFRPPNETSDRLYVFPDRAGTQTDPPDLTEWPEDLLGPNEAATPTPEPTPEPTPTPTPTPTPDAEPTPTSTATPEDEEETSADDDGPGFGIAGAVGGLGALAYALRRRAADRAERE